MKKLSLQWRLTLLISALFLAMCTGQMLVNSLLATRQMEKVVTMMRPALEGATVQAEVIDIGQYHALTSQTFLQNWGVLAIVMVLGALFAFLLVGYCLKPLHELTAHIRETDMSNLTTPAGVSASADEVAQLTQAYQELSSRLSRAFSEQQRFLADAAHELRTPLAVLQAKLDVFSKQAHTPEEYEALLSAVRRQTGRLTALANQLLDLTRERTVRLEEFRLEDLCYEVMSDLEETAKTGEVTIDSHIPADFVVKSDYAMLYQIVFNLVENGVKYNHPGGAVSVRASKSQDQWVLEVQDTGCGIPPDARESVFQPFHRMDASRSRKLGGAGLGLAIVKELGSCLGACIRITDAQAGGTTFSISFEKNRAE